MKAAALPAASRGACRSTEPGTMIAARTSDATLLTFAAQDKPFAAKSRLATNAHAASAPRAITAVSRRPAMTDLP